MLASVSSTALLSMPSSQRESEYQRDRPLGLSGWEQQPGLPRFKAHPSVSAPPPSLHGFRSFHDHDHPCPRHNASVITPTMTTSTVTTSVTVHSTTKLLSPTQFLSLAGSSYSESMHTAKQSSRGKTHVYGLYGLPGAAGPVFLTSFQRMT